MGVERLTARARSIARCSGCASIRPRQREGRVRGATNCFCSAGCRSRFAGALPVIRLRIVPYSEWVGRPHRNRTRLAAPLTTYPRSSVESLRSRHGPGASPLDHSWITHSRHRTALGGHQRTPAWSISYSRGRRGSLSDTGGHGTDTVRDREAPGSNPGPPTSF